MGKKPDRVTVKAEGTQAGSPHKWRQRANRTRKRMELESEVFHSLTCCLWCLDKRMLAGISGRSEKRQEELDEAAVELAEKLTRLWEAKQQAG